MNNTRRLLPCHTPRTIRGTTLVAAAVAAVLVSAGCASAQVPARAPLPVTIAPPPSQSLPPQQVYDAKELDRIASPIALYPDPLLAQVLSAATYSSQIPAAMQWVDGHRGLSGQQLADALASEQVSWDPSVQALVAFPTVLNMMATSMPWTAEIGDAFLTQHADVMDAVQRLRAQAQRYGYLQSTPQIAVTRAPVIEIVPVNPDYVVVPYYDPVIVFAPPRPRFVISNAIYLGFGVRLGLWYEPWGYRSSGFYWPAHRVVAGYPGWNRPWNYYDYRRPPVYVAARREEHGMATPRGYERPRSGQQGDNSSRREGSRNDGQRTDGQRNGGQRSGGQQDNGRATPQDQGRVAQPRARHDEQPQARIAPVEARTQRVAVPRP